MPALAPVLRLPLGFGGFPVLVDVEAGAVELVLMAGLVLVVVLDEIVLGVVARLQVLGFSVES